MDKELLGMLACPKCKGNITLKGMFILCRECGLAYPILDKNIPDMLVEDAWDIQKARKHSFKHELKL